MTTSAILGRISILLCTFFIYSSAYSQASASQWLFGEFGLEFQQNTVSIRHDYAPHENRGAGIISDEQGDLLFYTDGFNVWNRQHEMMPNGDTLLINHRQHTIHESLVVRWPGSESHYIIFTADPYNGQEASGLYYSVVDLSLEGGLGDVSLKGQKLLDIVSNKITAVLHKNRRDVWLITHGYDSNNYYAYLVSDAGITATPAISSAGPVLTSSFYGQLKASPDGKRVACSHEETNGNQFVIFDFDDLTGILSNPMAFPLPETIRAANGIEFSSDATKLLVYQTGSFGESGLYQFNLASPVFEDILESRTLLMKEQYNSFSQMQIARNGSIYITKGGGSGGTGHLGVIQYPNNLGSDCFVLENGLFLEGAITSGDRTPNFNQSYFFKTDFTLDNRCQSSPISFQITNNIRLDSARWFFGEGSLSTELDPVFEYSESGEYIIQLYAYYPDKTDTISKAITIHPAPVFDLGNDTTACPMLQIGVEDNFVSYQWNTGESYPAINADTEGWYKLTVENNFGCTYTDSMYVSLYDLPDILLPEMEDLTGRDSVQLFPGEFQSYRWTTGDTTQTIYVLNPGWYSVKVENEFECQAAGSVYVSDGSQPAGRQKMYGWEILNPLPSLMAGHEVCFVDEQNGFIITENELLRTRDGGESWEWNMELISGRHMAFSKTIGYIVGAGGTIYKSTHMGEGWNKLQVDFTEDLNTITVLHPDTLMVTGDHNLYVSFDGGQSWETRPVPGVDIEASFFTGILAGHVACKEGTILKTMDGGLNWYTTESANYIPSDFFDILFIDAEFGFASRQHSVLLRTTDGGESWEEVNDYLEAAYDIYFVDENEGYLAGTGGSIFKTTDGGLSWERHGYQGLIGGTDLLGIHFLNKYKGFAVGERGRILQSSDAGNTWEEYAPTYNKIHQVAPTSTNILYALGVKLHKSIDGGETWETLNTGIHNHDHYTYEYIEGQFFSSEEFYVIASAGEISRVLKSTDGGFSFDTLRSEDKDIRATSIHFLDQQTGYACNSYSSWSGLHKTGDGGQTWEYLSSYRFRDIWFLDENTGFATIRDELYRTGNGGYTWDKIYQASEDLNKINFPNDTVGYISGDNGLVLKTSDQGLSWQELSTGYDDNYGIYFCDQYIGYVTGEYRSLNKTIDGGQTWELQYLPATVSFITISEDFDVFVAGAGGVILKNASELKQANISISEAEQLTGSSVLLQANIFPGGRILSPVYFDYGINGEFSDSVLAQPTSLNPNTSQKVSAEINGLETATQYSFRIRAFESESIHYSDTITYTLQQVSGVKDLNDVKEVILFPNPARDVLQIDSSEPMETIRIFDIHGRLLSRTKYQPQVDISELEPGPYIISIYGKNSSFTGRFLKE